MPTAHTIDIYILTEDGIGSIKISQSMYFVNKTSMNEHSNVNKQISFQPSPKILKTHKTPSAHVLIR